MQGKFIIDKRMGEGEGEGERGGGRGKRETGYWIVNLLSCNL